jgi:hypothetical protein
VYSSVPQKQSHIRPRFAPARYERCSLGCRQERVPHPGRQGAGRGPVPTSVEIRHPGSADSQTWSRSVTVIPGRARPRGWHLSGPRIPRGLGHVAVNLDGHGPDWVLAADLTSTVAKQLPSSCWDTNIEMRS